MSRNLSVIGVFLFGAVAVFLAGNGLQAQEILIKTENGIPVVYNPKEPVPLKGQPSSLTLKPDFTIGLETEDINYVFSGLQHTQVDEREYIYAADWKETLIKVYDKNGKHVRSFGRKGQGPGEIGLPFYLGIFQGNKIVVNDQTNAKFIIYSREGELIREVPKEKFRALQRFKVDSKGCIYAFSRTFDQAKTIFELKKFSPAFDPLEDRK